jgi:hypothetical protein
MTKNLITAPDTDLSEHFTVMLIDFEWPEIQEFTQAVNKLSGKVSVFLYGSNDTDVTWCMTTAIRAHAVLMDMRNPRKIELIKGALLHRPNVYTLGKHQLDKCYHNEVIDMFSWLSIQYKQYHTEGKHGIRS